jgi:divalent metal cation (Fe/Co/Zn/Cd) transporter
VAEHSGSLRVIIAAIAGNVAIAICKFGAALVTGSAAMYSEAIGFVTATRTSTH